MRRTTRARALSAAVLSGAALGVWAGTGIPAVAGEPAAEVSPGTVEPGGSVTVTVTCTPSGGPAPETVDATSQAFTEGTVPLHRVAGHGDGGHGDGGHGDGGHEDGGEGDAGHEGAGDGDAGDEGAGDGDAGRGDAGHEGAGEEDAGHEGAGEGDAGHGDAGHEGAGDGEAGDGDTGDEGAGDGDVGRRDVGAGDKAGGAVYRGTARIAPAADSRKGPDAVGPQSEWTADGTCPAAPGGEGTPWSATFTVSRGGGGGTGTGRPPCREPHGEACREAGARHGVQAGQGGTFTDSVPAQAAGGLLIAGALAAAVHRLCRRGPARDR
ncbi:hypothetical protein GCM10010129_25490 [Streptomyces fumigatiscleroticus]|nr:hypothetical protein GCM10010129_25490 [Streptomyces fumigatiscleroticus]